MKPLVPYMSPLACSAVYQLSQIDIHWYSYDVNLTIEVAVSIPPIFKSPCHGSDFFDIDKIGNTSEADIAEASYRCEGSCFDSFWYGLRSLVPDVSRLLTWTRSSCCDPQEHIYSMEWPPRIDIRTNTLGVGASLDGKSISVN